MTEDKDVQAKVTKPHVFFNEPQHVVADPELSAGQKVEALDQLEQDARQLSEAAAEGMTGGEATGLHDVLDARSTLAGPSLKQAYEVVLDHLRTRSDGYLTPAALRDVAQALAALEKIMADGVA